MTYCDKFENAVVRNTPLTIIQWREFSKMAEHHCGKYDKNKTYAGPSGVGDMLVPDLCFSFGAYVHDCFYHFLQNSVFSAKYITRKNADDVFNVINTETCAIKHCGFFKRVWCT